MIEWKRFLPPAPLRDTGPKEPKVGETWAVHNRVGTAFVGQIDDIEGRDTCESVSSGCWRLLAGKEVASCDTDGSFRFSVLIRHADGRWADGYGPDGPCADRAAGKAAPTVERKLRSGWIVMSSIGRARNNKCANCAASDPTYFHYAHNAVCLACAPAMGVLADSPVTDAAPSRESVPMCPRCQRRQFDCRCAVAVPQPAKVAPPFKCTGAYCKTPNAPKATQSKMPIPPDWCVVCFDGLAAAYMNAGGLEPDGPLPPKQPRVRDIYSPEMSEGADPDWVL